MSAGHYRYVLVGAGPASGAAALAIRRRDPEGSLVIVGLEVHRPYRRPALSRQLLRADARGHDFFTLDEQWLIANHVELRTGQRVAQLDLTHRAVILESGQALAFEHLLLATGASPRPVNIPGANLPGVYYLRRIEDADRLHHALERARTQGRPHAEGRGRAVVLGADMLGLALAATLRDAGLAVALVFAGPYLLSPHGGAALHRFLQAHLERRGLAIHAGVAATRIEGDGRAQRVVLSSGVLLECDLVAPALGIVPNKELLRGTSIRAEQHILVDDQCRTSVPDVYAAGDVAAVFDPAMGKYRPLEHWDSALESGSIAGRNMAGQEAHYAGIAHYELTALGAHIEVWGEGRHIQRRLVRGNTAVEAADFIELGLDAQGQVVLAVAVNHTGDEARLAEMVRQRESVLGREEALQDASRPLWGESASFG
jgi:3-phenylpropionate/trans-cinnamate dioxygenase ferredoxin reductase subunit